MSSYWFIKGARVHYTNWVPGHLGNFASPDQEDCVVLVPYQGGHWDDIPCGSSDAGPVHPIMCQYSQLFSLIVLRTPVLHYFHFIIKLSILLV